MKKYNLRNKKVVVAGLARSGVASAILLRSVGAEVFVSDLKDDTETRKNRRKISRLGIGVELGRHSEGRFKSADLIVVSPGVKFDALCLNWARSKNIPIISEIELAGSFCPAPIIAVTGTNGKSTTVTLIGEILRCGGRKVHICGNIGKPFSAQVETIAKDDIVSLEVSSFQLEACFNFKPKVAVILNFSRNHLDRHRDLDEYLKVKKQIFLNQDKNDFTVLNGDDPAVRDLALETKADVRFFSSLSGRGESIFGRRLDANQAAAISVAGIFGIKKEDCLRALGNFKGLEHRLELVDTIRGVDFINDSKATTVDAVRWALADIYKPVVLIAGGRDKGADFGKIKGLLRRKVKALILIGEAKDKIKQVYKRVAPVLESGSLQDAVKQADNITSEGDCVLLSPMCASFDMFKDYEERGNVFKDAVRQVREASSRL